MLQSSHPFDWDLMSWMTTERKPSRQQQFKWGNLTKNVMISEMFYILYSFLYSKMMFARFPLSLCVNGTGPVWTALITFLCRWKIWTVTGCSVDLRGQSWESASTVRHTRSSRWRRWAWREVTQNKITQLFLNVAGQRDYRVEMSALTVGFHLGLLLKLTKIKINKKIFFSHQEKCILTFNGNAPAGQYFIYLMVEDRIPALNGGADSMDNPLSAVPLHLSVSGESTN